MNGPALSLAELEALDPRAPRTDPERRFLCPLCGDGKPRDAGHRCLTVNTDTGAWHCHRCGAGGKLREHWEERHPRPRQKARRAFALPAEAKLVPADPEAGAWRARLSGLLFLAGTPGAEYLAGRGQPADLAHRAGARYLPGWFGRPAVLFPLRDRKGWLTAAHGRYTDGRTDPKARTAGTAGAGAFATPGAWEAERLILVEAPLDALTLAACGYPAIATVGTNLPDWLPRACAFRPVRIGTDADEAGDAAAERWALALAALGAKVERLRPEGGKDWNEILQRAPADLGAFLAAALAPAPALEEGNFRPEGELESDTAPGGMPAAAVGGDWAALSVGRLVGACRELGGEIALDGARLHLAAPPELPAELRAELKRRALVVARYLREEEGSPSGAGDALLLDVATDAPAPERPSPWR